MPTYTYKCENCGKFDEFHSINKKLDKCPKCGGKVERLISNAAVIHKWKGFRKVE
jgi:putative FmdB family regulatory protein